MNDQPSQIKLSMYGEIVLSTVDGPGERAVVHFAGCSIGCKGCFNPHTHAPIGDRVWQDSAQSIARRILAVSRDVTISGGEPTDQMDGLYCLLSELREHGATSVVMFSGRTRLWLLTLPLWRAIEALGLVDVLIDGPYVQARPEATETKGSNNQLLHFLTQSLQADDFMRREIEFSIGNDGRVSLVGFPDGDLIDLLY